MTFSAYGADYGTENIASDDASQLLGFVPELALVAKPEATGTKGGGGLVDSFMPHVPLLRRYLRRRVPDADLDDILQDVLLSIVRRADTDAVAHPRCYLFQAAQAALIDRRRRLTTRRADCHCELGEPDHPVDEISPLRVVLARDEVRSVEERLSELPERTREILVAIRLEGVSLKCLASRYDVSTSAIEKHVTKAAKALSTVRRGDRFAAAPRAPSPQRQKFLSGAI